MKIGFKEIKPIYLTTLYTISSNPNKLLWRSLKAAIRQGNGRLLEVVVIDADKHT